MSDVVVDPILGELRLADRRPVFSGGGSSNGAMYARVQLGTETPGYGFEGDMFYDTDDAILYVYANGTWNAISGGVVTVDGVYLTETGDYLITESGDYFATE